MIEKQITHIDPKTIVFSLEERQRQKNLDCGDIIPSIRKHGVLFPILVEKDTLRLLAGWRRLTSVLFLNQATIPVRFGYDLTERDRYELELEENVRRRDLDWQDRARSFYNLHQLFEGDSKDWTVEQTAQAMAYSERWTYDQISLGAAIAEGDQSIAACDTASAALTILTRRRARATENALNSIMELEDDDLTQLGIADGDNPGIAGGQSELDSNGTTSDQDLRAPSTGGGGTIYRGSSNGAGHVPPFAIHAADAHEWLSAYTGPKFNFLHCDLPYGVKLNQQAGQQSFEGGGYESSPDIYWALCRSLVENWDKFLYPRAHIMFWISMKFYEDTTTFFRTFGPAELKINPTPLIWHKTDNKGIIPDAQRGPRQIYEAALLMSTGDRHIVKPVSNVYGCPTAKGEDAIHTNEKPEPMLKHFFSMLVDSSSRIFDPTAGSGSAIRAAEALGAEAGLGLEFNPEFAARAQQKLISTRGLRQLSSIVREAETMELDTDSEEE